LWHGAKSSCLINAFSPNFVFFLVRTLMLHGEKHNSSIHGHFLYVWLLLLFLLAGKSHRKESKVGCKMCKIPIEVWNEKNRLYVYVSFTLYAQTMEQPEWLWNLVGTLNQLTLMSNAIIMILTVVNPLFCANMVRVSDSALVFRLPLNQPSMLLSVYLNATEAFYSFY